MKTTSLCEDKSSEMERTNIVGLLSKQQKLNSSVFFNSNMSMMVMEEEEETVMEAPRIGGRLSFLKRAARSSRSLLSSLAKQTSSRIGKRRMVMGTRALEEVRRTRKLVCLCLPMMMKEKSGLVVKMVAGGAVVEQVDSDSLLLKGDLILAVNGTLLAGKQVDEVKDLLTTCGFEQTHLLNLILWRSPGF